jgi:hypothetical protein
MNEQFLGLLEGDFNNFQQVRQQNTDTPLQVALTDYPHGALPTASKY